MLFRRKNTTEPPDRASLLKAKPLRHPETREHRLAEGALELSIALPKSRLARRFSRSGDRPVIRKFELDKLGQEVWRMMDGRTTVREMIEAFAGTHRLNLREAEVAMLAYLRTLAEKGILLMAVDGQDKPGSSD